MTMSQVLGSKGFEDSLELELKNRASAFLSICRSDEGEYRLTPASETSPFTLCFALFLSQLLGRLEDLKPEFPFLAKQVVKGLREYGQQREKFVELHTDKAFLQLLAFSLSSLHLLDAHADHPVGDIVEPLIPRDMKTYLVDVHAFEGVPQSGNLAMCMAVLAIYARDYLGMATDRHIADWVEGHLVHMNKYGFWGEERVTHLQFQNGYHQYEILEYLEVENPKIENAVEFVRQIADRRGQFAPYFGGSGCYDYDAISIVTSSERVLTDEDIALLKLTAGTILGEQNADGGFSESQWVRPRTPKSVLSGVRHTLEGEATLMRERGRYFVALLSPKHNRIDTHWTEYSRHWGESNLWDTWFRLLTLARIDCAINAANRKRWGFINFPGIGFHSTSTAKS